MGMPHEKVIFSHILNEAELLPYWLIHHRMLFDHGVIFDYGSTDESLEIISRLTPTWEIRETSNRRADIYNIDEEIMEAERTFPDAWKMVLNTTEFLYTHDLTPILDSIPSNHLGLRVWPYRVIEEPDILDREWKDRCLLHQFRSGEKGPTWDECPNENRDWENLRFRLLHRAPDGAYEAGRHITRHPDELIPIREDVKLFWFGSCGLPGLKDRRNKQWHHLWISRKQKGFQGKHCTSWNKPKIMSDWHSLLLHIEPLPDDLERDCFTPQK